MSLEETLAERRSIREYAPRLLERRELSQLLWATQGTTHAAGLRTAPSAGALYPLELYVALPDGVWRYLPRDHALQRVGDRDARPALWAAGLRQDPLRTAPAVFVFAAVLARTARKYGARAERYVLVEVGHAAENLLLQATALGLGGVPIGAFDDERVGAAVGLSDNEEALYLVPVGARP